MKLPIRQSQNFIKKPRIIMAGIDAENIAQQMIIAAKAVLGEKWPEAKIFVESE